MTRRFQMKNWRKIDGESLMWFQSHRHVTSTANFPATAAICPGCRDVLAVLESLSLEGR